MKLNKRSLYLKLSLVGIVIMFLHSCTSTKDIVYYQDVDSIAELEVPPAKEIILAQGNHDTWTEDDGYALAKDYFIKYSNGLKTICPFFFNLSKTQPPLILQFSTIPA